MKTEFHILNQFDPKPKSALAVQTNLNFNQECMGVCGV